jgi:hypothetical protein
MAQRQLLEVSASSDGIKQQRTSAFRRHAMADRSISTTTAWGPPLSNSPREKKPNTYVTPSGTDVVAPDAVIRRATDRNRCRTHGFAEAIRIGGWNGPLGRSNNPRSQRENLVLFGTVLV